MDVKFHMPSGSRGTCGAGFHPGRSLEFKGKSDWRHHHGDGLKNRETGEVSPGGEVEWEA